MLISTPGAAAQPLHTDTDGAQLPAESRGIKVQIGELLRGSATLSRVLVLDPLAVPRR